ncbi:MAG: sigma-70 family RNA polymerase sigma factor [Acidobacteria bacterium]|nr:MAG: sigma-70 family RNA polymerase sigma factor [Acidobacteriota bacterium]
MATSDAELVARALEGSQEAYRLLVRRFERPVMSVVLRLVGEPALAEDLTQETFLKAFRHLRRYDPRRKLASWLFKIAHNTAIDHLRRRRPELVSLERGDDDPPPDSRPQLAAPATQAPDLAAIRGELAAEIEASLAELRPGYREILVLRFQEGLSYQEIADVMELPMGTVKVHLHRARKQLAAALEARGWALPDGAAGSTKHAP